MNYEKKKVGLRFKRTDSLHEQPKPDNKGEDKTTTKTDKRTKNRRH